MTGFDTAGEDFLRNAEQLTIHDEQVLVIPVRGDGHLRWRQARAALTDRYPVLVLHEELVYEDDHHHDRSPAGILARAATIDVDTRVDEITARSARQRGTGAEGYHLSRYDVVNSGEPEALVILPRPEPWAAFAYLDSYAFLRTIEPELIVAAAHRWYTRHGAEPTVIGLSTGFNVARPPTTTAEAERLAAEHHAFAALTAGTTERAYARALLELDRWCLYDRP